jgi:hypothetical protein
MCGDVAADCGVNRAAVFPAKSYWDKNVEIMIRGLARKCVKLKDHFRCECVGFSFEFIGDLGSKGLLAVFGYGVDVALPGEDCVSRLMELQKRKFGDVNRLVEIDDSGGDMEDSEYFVERTAQCIAGCARLFTNASEESLVSKVLVGDEDLGCVHHIPTGVGRTPKASALRSACSACLRISRVFDAVSEQSSGRTTFASP